MPRNLKNRIIVNLKPSDRALIQAAADKAGDPLATFIRRVVIGYCIASKNMKGVDK